MSKWRGSLEKFVTESSVDEIFFRYLFIFISLGQAIHDNLESNHYHNH